MASPTAGLFRGAIAAVLFVALVWGSPRAGIVAFLAAGLALVYGILLVVGRPRILVVEPLAPVLLDALVLGLLLAGTGGVGSPFFPLYLLAALGMVGVSGPVKVAAGTAAMAGGYLVAAVWVGGAGVGLSAGLGAGCVGLSSLGVAYWASAARDLSSTLDAERDRAARTGRLVSGFGAALGTLSVEEILFWTVRAARDACGGTYAHAATLEGNHHASVLEGEVDACPSWWHPSIQGLLLRAHREGAAVRSEEEIHGTRGFLASPLGSKDRGGVIVGGGDLGAAEERALALISGVAGQALEAAENSPGGRDPVSGLPNRVSLHRVLRRELSQGRSLTVLAIEMAGLDRYNRTHGFAAGDGLLRRVGERLGSGRRVFHYGGDRFVVVLGGTDEPRARRASVAIRQAVSEEAGGLIQPAVGFAHAGPEAGDSDPVLKSALLAAREAGPEGVAGPTEVSVGPPSAPAGIVEALMGALEAKDPGIGEHLRGVCRISRDIARWLGMSEEQVEELTDGALLHDVGKVGIPDHILHKPGRLTEEEYGVIKRHPGLGAEIVAPAKGLAASLPMVRHHHERFDGGGYPDGLRGEDIPLTARVVSVADAFDSMIRSRPYGYGVSREAALREIEANSGTQFDPRVVEALRAVLGDVEDHRTGSDG